MKKRSLFTAMAVVGTLAIPSVFAPHTAHAAIAAGSVVVNEIMYNQASGTSVPEWVELYNTTGSSIDLSGYKVTDNAVGATSLTEGVYTLPSGTVIPAGGYLTIGNSYSSAQVIWSGNIALSNSGDNFALFYDANGDNLAQSSEVIDDVDFSSTWGGNGNGYSIERISATGASSSSTNWGQSTVSGGTPGAVNSIASGGGGGGGGGTTGTDPYEPNDSQSAAYGPITSGSTYNGYIGTSTDQDWFKFTTGGSGTISVNLGNLPADYDLYLYDSTGTQVATSQNGGTTAESISYNSTAAGTYYVEVVGYNGASSTTQAYSLSATYPTSGGGGGGGGTASGTVMWDNAHGETAGNADWTISGANSSFADALKAKGFTVTQNTSTITSSTLSGVKVFVIPEPNVNFTSAEKTAINNYVANGGSVYFIADHITSDRNNDGWDSVQIYDGSTSTAYPSTGSWVGATYGFYFNFNNLSADPITDVRASAVTSGVSSVGYWNGSSIHSTGSNSSIVQDIFMSGQPDPIHIHGTYGSGRFAALGDSSLYDDGTGAAGKNLYDGWDADNDSTLAVNTVLWLARVTN